MDLVLSEAPLDNSFQKEKRELVNKGSLGRRRKPSRSNLKLLLSPAADTSQSPKPIRNVIQPAPSIKVSRSTPTTPVDDTRKVDLNGNRIPLRNHCKIALKIESSLPRTPPETNHYVNDAQQFTIEAKLKRRKTDSGRSAVLIQTWERRTRSDSFSRQSRPKYIARNNRFQNKENLGGAAIMPESRSACSKYNGNFTNNQWSNEGGFVNNVRDGYSNETMLYQKPKNGICFDKVTHMHLSNYKSADQEPEWISLSKKLRAKFVEGHIEPNSTDSYLHEEPVGVEPSSVHQPIHLPLQKPKTQITQQPQKTEKKIKIVVDTSEVRNQNGGEPPWIQLSRKLCTKFIEEHIEYPIITKDAPIPISPDLLECNGDVRIIEKIGKPKGRKSKIRKDSEPEWVSLSKKLRAKFIESHIDDPDTISLDNQLNASDPEETSSDSLPTSSPEITPKKPHNPSSNHESNSTSLNKVINHVEQSKENYPKPVPNGHLFTEKECCWEYQEMEFDQESISGNFQEPEFINDNSLQNTSDSYSKVLKIQNKHASGEHPKQFVPFDETSSKRMSFAESANYEPFYNAECYNNDVRFAPQINEVVEATNNNSNFDKKYITVQFVAHPDTTSTNFVNSEYSTSKNSVPLISPSKNNNSDFFNISTWEEAHYKSDDGDAQRTEVSLSKNFNSKSMDNICEIDDGNCFEEPFVNSKNEQKKISKLGIAFSKTSPISKSENVLDQIESTLPTQKRIDDFNENTDDTIFDEDSQSFSSKPLSRDVSTEYDGSIPETLQHITVSQKSTNKNVNNNGSYQEHKVDEPKKQFKCNGIIPNSEQTLEYHKKEKKSSTSSNSVNGIQKKRIQSKSINMNESLPRNEYANVNPLADSRSHHPNEVRSEAKSNHKISEKIRNESILTSKFPNHRHDYAKVMKTNTKNDTFSSRVINGDANINDRKDSNSLRMKSKSMCDISRHREANSSDESSLCRSERQQNGDSLSQYAIARSKASSELKFQHFESEADIPLCAKLIKSNGKCSTSSISSSYNRNASPCSESSHVYEDMFKETTSGPSDSETSSWTVMKNNSYYINGRSSSMNDLDYSDSCSMSVKCDYASSCSEHSTLQSRHSSCNSSSFYVNLRDYDSHMLEPSLNRRKDHNRKVSNGNTSKIINSNPPTPESLRHLFTSPFNSNPHRGNRLMNKLPSEPEIHYYSTTTSATSSAFKHGFDPSPPKPKKTERSSSIKIKDIAHGIILTFRKFQNHSKNSHVSSTHYVDVSHLAESGPKNGHTDSNKSKSKKDHKDNIRKQEKKGIWGFPFENGKTDSDSGCHLSASEVQRAKARRSSSDLTGKKTNLPNLLQDTISENIGSEKKKSKSAKKSSNARDKGKKNRSKSMETKTIPTVSRKVQQMADGTLYLVTTVSGDTALPGVYSDSPDTSSELSSHKPVKSSGESNC